jgi:hypothetical protein
MGMAVVATRPSVTTTATLIAQNTSADPGESNEYRNWRFLIKNFTASADVFLGPTGVTAGTGFQWASGDGPLAIELEPGESLYGIVTGTTQVLHVLKVGR